jgi:molecular chaperone GrpE
MRDRAAAGEHRYVLGIRDSAWWPFARLGSAQGHQAALRRARENAEFTAGTAPGALDREWHRALAETAKLRRRFARNVARITEQERAELARRWLPVVDHLDRALQHPEAAPREMVDEVRAVRDETVRVVAELGFPRRDDVGETFDPARHNAVGLWPADGAPQGTVARVLLPAYGFGSHQLRPALVMVAD